MPPSAAQNVLLMALTLVAFKLSITDMVPVRTRGANHHFCSYPSAAPGQSAVNALAAEALCSVVVPCPLFVQMLRHPPFPLRSRCSLSVAALHSCASHLVTALRCPLLSP